jgi:general secretion pathway protein G
MEKLNKKRKSRQGGFTLIELLVVIAIIAILGAVVAPKILQNPEKARKAAAMASVKAVQLQADIYQLDNAKPISSINELVPKYFDDLPKDPWGGDYVVTLTSDGTAKITCPKLDELKAQGISKTDVEMGR